METEGWRCPVVGEGGNVLQVFWPGRRPPQISKQNCETWLPTILALQILYWTIFV